MPGSEKIAKLRIIQLFSANTTIHILLFSKHSNLVTLLSAKDYDVSWSVTVFYRDELREFLLKVISTKTSLFEFKNYQKKNAVSKEDTVFTVSLPEDYSHLSILLKAVVKL